MTTDPYQQPAPAQPYGHHAPTQTASPPAGYAPAGYAAAGYQPLPQPHLAHWGRRVLASVIDSALAGTLLVVTAVYALTTATPTGEVGPTGTPETEPTVLGGLLLLLGWAVQIGIWVWNRVIRQGRTGRSVGKSVLRIRLLGEQTMAPVGPGTALGRDFAHLVDGIFYLGYLWPLWDGKRQTFADKMVGTVVVREG